MRISDWSSDVCSSDLPQKRMREGHRNVSIGTDEHRSGKPQQAGELILSPVIRLDLVTRSSSTSIFSRSEEHTSELQSLMRISYAVFCLKKKKDIKTYQVHMSRYTSYNHHKNKHQYTLE